MVSFSTLDISIIVFFFIAVIAIGFLSGRKQTDKAEEYLLSGRKVGLFLFVLTNVATWYGGILGVGEFTYRYGLVSWFTQGFPYYIFAILFAIFLAPKVRQSNLITIPDKIQNEYGRTAGIISAVLIFILVSPAPYLLMIANLISMIFGISLMPALLISFFLSTVYLIKGGFKADLYTDAFEFFVMFVGFIIILSASNIEYGGLEFLSANLPESHLSFTGNNSVTFIIVWFLIALWTFTDPGFHQRCYAAKSSKVAKYGIIISVFFWALFDFLTTSTGLYARAAIPDLQNPVMSFPMLAEKTLSSGFKGVFYAALFATILSTLNSFLFLSATTFSRDLINKIVPGNDEKKLIRHTRIGLLLTGIIAIIIALKFNSVIYIWYTLGSICIPGIILLIISAYFPAIKIGRQLAATESILAVLSGLNWYILREYNLLSPFLSEIEPMVIGLLIGLIIHFYGLINIKGRFLME